MNLLGNIQDQDVLCFMVLPINGIDINVLQVELEHLSEFIFFRFNDKIDQVALVVVIRIGISQNFNLIGVEVSTLFENLDLVCILSFDLFHNLRSGFLSLQLHLIVLKLLQALQSIEQTSEIVWRTVNGKHD